MGAGCGTEDFDMSPRNDRRPQLTRNGQPVKYATGGQQSLSDQFKRIADRFTSIEQLQEGLRSVGMESSNRMRILNSFTKN
jgi:hypothetical protein